MPFGVLEVLFAKTTGPTVYKDQQPILIEPQAAETDGICNVFDLLQLGKVVAAAFMPHRMQATGGIQLN